MTDMKFCLPYWISDPQLFTLKRLWLLKTLKKTLLFCNKFVLTKKCHDTDEKIFCILCCEMPRN